MPQLWDLLGVTTSLLLISTSILASSADGRAYDLTSAKQRQREPQRREGGLEGKRELGSKQPKEIRLQGLDGSRRPSNRPEDLQATLAQLKAGFAANGHQLASLNPNSPQRGIVIPAGGRRLLANAYIVVKTLRGFLNCTLPIEVYYYGQDEVDATVLGLIKGVWGVEVRDASLLPQPKHLGPWPEKLSGYAKKIFCLYSCSFQEVLLLDCDSLPLHNPDTLFDLPAYRVHGDVFWPDYWTAKSALEAPKEGIYQMLGLAIPWETDPLWACVESGQLLFNRKRHAASLKYIMFLNLWHDIVYKLVLGDKDTFEIGFMLADEHKEFFRMPVPPRAAFSAVTDEGFHLHVGMLQSIRGRPAFLHRTTGGKFDPAKGAAQQLRATYFSEPMSVKAAKKYIWHSKMAINVLPAERAQTDPTCQELNPVTRGVLSKPGSRRKRPDSQTERLRRLTECPITAPMTGDLVPLLPIPLYGAEVEAVLRYSHAVFAANFGPP